MKLVKHRSIKGNMFFQAPLISDLPSKWDQISFHPRRAV